MSKIIFRFEDKNIPEKIVETEGLQKSILEITEDQGIHLNHNCGGVCACSTCHVYVLKGDSHLEEISEKEEDFIDRAINPRLESRLACQCIILKESAEIMIEIPDQKIKGWVGRQVRLAVRAELKRAQHPGRAKSDGHRCMQVTFVRGHHHHTLR